MPGQEGHLAGEIRSAARTGKSLIEAVAAYQAIMLPRGVEATDNSRRLAAQPFGAT